MPVLEKEWITTSAVRMIHWLCADGFAALTNQVKEVELLVSSHGNARKCAGQWLFLTVSELIVRVCCWGVVAYMYFKG